MLRLLQSVLGLELQAFYCFLFFWISETHNWLPLTIKYFTTRIHSLLVNTGSTLLQTANEVEGMVGQRAWGPRSRGLEWACTGSPIYLDLFPGWQVANEIAKPQVSINSNYSSIECIKTAT